MNQLLNAKKPTTEQQLAFVRELLTEPVRVVKTSETLNMFKAIEENLVAVKLWNQTHAGTPSELVSGVGKAVDELVDGLIQAKESIKVWHNMEGRLSGEAQRDAERSWKIYDRMSPEMVRINTLIRKYKPEEVSHG